MTVSHISLVTICFEKPRSIHISSQIIRIDTQINLSCFGKRTLLSNIGN